MSGPGVAKAHPTPEEVAERLSERGLLDGVRAIAINNHVSLLDVCGRATTGSIRRARRTVWELLRSAGLSFPEIGAIFGRDHSTIQHVIRPRPRSRSRAA